MENKASVDWIADTRVMLGLSAVLYGGIAIYKIFSWISSLSSRKRGILTGLTVVGLLCSVPSTNYRLQVVHLSELVRK